MRKWCHCLSHTAGSWLFISWCTLDAKPDALCTASALIKEAVLSRTWALPKWPIKENYGSQWMQRILKEEAWRQWGIKTLQLSNCRSAKVEAVALRAGTAIWQAAIIITFISTQIKCANVSPARAWMGGRAKKWDARAPSPPKQWRPALNIKFAFNIFSPFSILQTHQLCFPQNNQQNGVRGLRGLAALWQTQSKVHFHRRHIKSRYLTHVADIEQRCRSAFSTLSTTTVQMPTENIGTSGFKTL